MNYIILIFYSIILPIISLKQNKPKLCINCKYFITDNITDKFGRCSFFPKPNGKINYLVNGINDDEYFFCSTSRETNSMCGEEGKYYKKNAHIRPLKKTLEDLIPPSAV
jgi:hypothetical protein